MWVFYFLLAVTLCDAAALGKKVVSSASEKNGTEYLTDGTGTEDVKDTMEKIANEFLQDLIDARSLHGNRQKREVISDMRTSSLADKEGIFRLKRIKPFLSVCSRPISIAFVDVNNSSYSVCISTPADDTPTTANIAQVTTKGILPLDSWYTNNPSKAVAFYDGQELDILVADSGRGDGTDLMKFNFTSQKSVYDHTVHSKHATAIALWKMKMDGKFQLAIANSNGNKESSDLTTEIFTYNWIGTYFDKYSSITAYDVKDIEPFHIHSMAYLAVANHRRGKGNYHVDSEILKYNLDQKKWLSLQKIRTYGAMDWEFFTMGSGAGKEFYLAVANYVERGNHDINSVIYKFVKDKFVPFQCLLTSGATSIAALSDGSRFLLAIANEFEAVHLYQYDGWRFVPASVQFTQSTMSSGVSSVSFHTIKDYQGEKLVLAVSNPKVDGPSLYELEFAHENALGRWHSDSTEWCMSILDTIEQSESGKTLIDMNSVIYTDQEQPVVINGNLSFDNGFQASVISTPKLIDIANEKTYDASILLKLKNLKLRLAEVEQRLQKAEEILRRAVTLNGSQTLLGNYNFKDLRFNCEDQSCQFEKIDTISLNGEDISYLKDNVVFVDEEMFDHALNIEKIKVRDLRVHGLLDGVYISNLVTKSGSHDITGTKTFINPITTEVVNVAGLVDGVKVTPHTILLNGEFQNATGNLSFVDIDTSSLEVSKLVNGVNLDAFYRNVVLYDKSYTITGRKTFSDVVAKDLNTESVNGVDLSDLWNKVMWTDSHQEITAPMTFSTISTENDLTVDGKVNGLKVPGPEILLVNSNAVINAPKLFKNTAKMSKLDVSGSINGIKILKDTSGENQLDVLLKNGVQIITGEKTFREIFLDDHSYVSGTVNGIRLSELQRIALHKNTSISGDSWVFNNLEVKGPLTVHGSISGIDLDDIYTRVVKLSDTAMPNFETVSFQDEVQINILQSEDLNGLDLTKDLVFTKKPQTIRGVKTFKDINLAADSEVLGLVNNINITFLQESILKLGNQVITVPRTVEGDLRIKRLNVSGLVNNIKVADLVTLSGQETITGPKTFTNMKIKGNLYVKNLEVAGLVNNVDITEKMKNTMTYNGAQMISGPKSVNGKITLSKDSNLDTDSLNDIDISSVWEDSVRVDIPQNISGNKVFAGPVSFGKFWFHKSLDGVTEWDLKYNLMLQDLDQEIFGDVILASGANLSNINLSGYVNGVNITELNNTMVKRNDPAVISGPVIFEGNVVSYGDVSLTGKIQNVDLSEEAVRKSKHNVITGEKEFLNDLSVMRDLIVAGLIDGVSVHDFCENSVFLKENHKLNGLTVKGNVVFEDGVMIGGLLAGVDIDTLYGLSFKEHEEESFFSGLKTFENLTIEGPITLYGKIGGVDLQFLKDTYMSLSRDQEVATSLHFDKITVEGTISSSNFYTHDNKVNDIDIVQLEKSVLKTTGPQSITATYRFGKVIFGDDVIVVGRVNAIEMPKGLMRKNRTNYVYNSKVFKKNVTVLGDLMMEDGKTVQDVDVSEWERKSVFKDKGKYVIDGLKIFSDVTTSDVWVHGTVDGVKIAEDSLLMNYGDQSIESTKEIVGGITLLRNLTVDGLINRVNLEDIARRAAKRGDSNKFTGVKYFSQPIAIGALETGLINGVDIRKLNKTIYTNLNFGSLVNRMAELKEAVAEMQDAFDNQAILFQYYEYLQGFGIPGSYSWHYVAAPDTKELLLLSDISLLQSGCTSIKTFVLDPETQRFDLRPQNLLASYAVAMKSIFMWDSTYLFVANRVPSSSCSYPDQIYAPLSGNGTTPGHIFVWSNENEMFYTYQTLLMEPATDVAVFSDHETVCAVYTEVRDTKLYCANETQKQLVWRETLQTRSGRTMSLMEDDSDWPLIRLAIAGVDHNYDYVSYVDIYNWKGEIGTFGLPVQRIKTTNAQSVMFMLYPDMYSTLFLVISDGTVTGVGNVPRLLIYKLDDKKNQFIKYQEIKDSGHLEWMTLPSRDLIFFVLDKTGNVNIYRYRQASGFVRADTLYDTGSQTFHAFTRIDPADSNHYLALAGPQSILPHDAERTDFAKILKSSIKGKRLLY